MISGIKVRNHEECALFKQDDLIGLDSVAEFLQRQLKLVDVGQQDAHNLGPSLVQGFVPNRGAEALSLILEVVRCLFHDSCLFLEEHFVTHVFPNQVHFMNEDKDLCVL